MYSHHLTGEVIAHNEQLLQSPDGQSRSLW